MARAKLKARSKAKSRAKRKAPARRAAPRKAAAKVRPKHKFVAKHFREEDFKEGLRAYAKYRDLGMAEATGGMVQAHVIRLVPPCIPEEVSKLHYHDVDFKMVYVLKGWMTSEFEGQGPVTMREGTCWIQPPGIKHKVLDYSDDCEVLEVILPAEFETVTLE